VTHGLRDHEPRRRFVATGRDQDAIRADRSLAAIVADPDDTARDLVAKGPGVKNGALYVTQYRCRI
jgi:hypothetical protein